MATANNTGHLQAETMPVARIRVAMVAPGEIFGGAERQILTLLRAMRETTVSTLITFNDTELARFAREQGLAVQVVGASGLVDFASLARLRAALREFAPDVVHMHGYRAAVYCALARVPDCGYVKTEHGRIESASGGFVDRGRATLYATLERVAGGFLGTHSVCVTKELADSRRARATRPEVVIYNGIEPGERATLRRPQEYARDRFNIAAVGRLDTVKGLEFALQAMAGVAMPASVSLHLVGTGPLDAPLRRMAQELGVEDRVRFSGFRSNAHDYIAHADALIMPSLHEGLPYTILEAMSLGTPILASGVGGLEEILRHGETALLFQPGNVAEICKSVALLLADESLRGSLIAAARADCEARFTAAAMAAQYVDLYRSVRH